MPSKRISKPKSRGWLDINPDGQRWQQRLCVGTPSTGLVRIEWVHARFGAIIPCNWSVADVSQMMSSAIPLKYQVADAQNLIVKTVIEQGFKHLLFIEHDNLIPPNFFTALNEYMIEDKVPVVSGLYFTKSVPPEPLVYRGIGNGYYDRWKLGDKVWVSGIPMGMALIHASILKAMWDESPEYKIGSTITRRVFDTPNEKWTDPSGRFSLTQSGTSDLAWCKRVVEGRYFEKAGWPQYQAKKWPFLVDTGLFGRHIDPSGNQFPLEMPKRFIR